MSSFTKGVWLEPVDDRNWRVRTEGGNGFFWAVGDEDSTERVHINEGFVTDLASVPWLLRFIVPTYGRHSQAAVLHDKLYRSNIHSYSRAQADQMFYEAMMALNVRKLRAKIMFWAVRAFGLPAWRRGQARGRTTGPLVRALKAR